MYKTCSSCGLQLEANRFSKNKSKSMGLQNECKSCTALYKRRYYAQLQSRGMVIPKEKVCSTCKKCKPAAEFFRWSYSADGLNANCGECDKGKVRAYERARPDKARARKQAWIERNPEGRAAASAKYAKANQGKANNQAAKRRAYKLKATPTWVDSDHLWFIEEIYLLAKQRSLMLGYPWEVDHIVPLQGPNVCGLHVYWNLQVVTRGTNRKKGNRL